MTRNKAVLLAAIGGGLFVSGAQGAISYTVPGSLYTEGFNSLPLDTRSSNNIEENTDLTPTNYSDGWQDDVDWTTSPEKDVSVLGWHLYHETSPLSENGFNGFQRYRQGTGNSGTGAFYGFASSSVSNAEKALGVVSSNSITPAGSRTFIALELVNNTGGTLSEFTLTYNGEQWRDEAATSDPLEFAWALGKTDFGGADPWYAGGGYSAVAALNFSSPTTGTLTPFGLDGNLPANRIADITATVTGVNWAPGQSLWLRWRDTNASGNDDGLAIDDVRFTATPEPAGLTLIGISALGLLARRRA